MNLSAFVYGATCLFRPSLLRPSLVFDEFSDIPTDIGRALNRVSGLKDGSARQATRIQALVIDKDNCIAEAGSLEICPRYYVTFSTSCASPKLIAQTKWKELRSAFPGARILIVSNSSGSASDTDDREAQELSENLGAEVLIHEQKKPACHSQVMHHLKSAGIQVNSPLEVVIIGDRLFTDVLMANLMGSHSIWLVNGTRTNYGILSRFEKTIYNSILR